ncbi:MAG: hypothetical protein ACRDZO_16075 [Egibacteraceae bacterium]
MSAPQVVIPERGTGLRRHAVLTDGQPGRWLWVRWPGPEAPCAFTDVPPALRDALASVRTPAGSRLVVGQPFGHARQGARRYPMTGIQSIAERLIASRGGGCATYVPAVRELGGLLRRLHDVAVPAGVPPHPPALDRLRGWLGAPELSAQHGTTRAVVRDRLSDRRWELMGEWLDDLLAAERVLAHGWLGLGQCTVQEADGTVTLVVGEDVGCAPWTFDVGWVAGQIMELRHFLGTAETRSEFDQLLEAWWEGYGRAPDQRVHRAAALDVALHVNDFSAYFTVADGEPTAWADLLVQLIDIASGP